MKNRNRHHPSRIIPVVLLTAVLLAGCGGSAKKQTAEATVSSEPTPSAKTVSYTEKTYREFTFQIPDIWFQSETDGDSITYMPDVESPDVMLNVDFVQGNGSMAEETNQQQLEDMLQKSGGNKISSGGITIADDHAGYEMKFKVSGNHQTLQKNMLSFDDQGGIVFFTLTILDGTQEKYEPIYETIVTSIAVNPEAAVSTEPTAQTEEKASSTPAATEDSVSFREAMDSYETFFDEYAAFMQKYKASNDAASMLADYSTFLTRYADVMQKIGAIDSSKLSADDAAYYLQVMARIEQKLASIQ